MANWFVNGILCNPQILMLNYLCRAAAMAIALAPIMPTIARAQTVLTDRYPTVSSADIDTLPCYMQTADGTTLDLAALCPKPVPFKSTPGQALLANPNVVVNGLNYDGYALSGQVMNQTGQPVRGVTVNYEIVDRRGNPVDAGAVQSQSLSLPPGASAPFTEASNHPGATAHVLSVDWQY